jgi:hypothetical protein
VLRRATNVLSAAQRSKRSASLKLISLTGRRVRTGRFRRSRCRGTVVKGNPPLPYVWDPLIPPPLGGQSTGALLWPAIHQYPLRLCVASWTSSRDHPRASRGRGRGRFHHSVPRSQRPVKYHLPSTPARYRDRCLCSPLRRSSHQRPALASGPRPPTCAAAQAMYTPAR